MRNGELRTETGQSIAENGQWIVTRTFLNLQVRHFDFEFLLKADDDSFVCLTRIASMLHDLDPAVTDKVYAGVPTACNQTTNPDYWVRAVQHIIL